jgi:hypothetical protein
VDQRIEELLRDARRATKIDLERVELFEALVRTPGWLAYVEILEAKLQMFADQILAPAQSIDGMVMLEYVKGAMSGLVIARDIPSVTIAAKDQLRTQPVTEMDDDDDA